MAKGGARVRGAPAVPRRALAQMGSCGPFPESRQLGLDLRRAGSNAPAAVVAGAIGLVRQRPRLPGSDHLGLVSGEFWVAAAVVWWTSLSSMTTSCFRVGGSNCNCILPVSISPGEMVFGQGENPAR
jgi:hypothetical protein